METPSSLCWTVPFLSATTSGWKRSRHERSRDRFFDRKRATNAKTHRTERKCHSANHTASRSTLSWHTSKELASDWGSSSWHSASMGSRMYDCRLLAVPLQAVARGGGL